MIAISHHIIRFFLCCIAWGCFPFIAFSQQEEPKRVSIIVIAKEINTEKEIVQLPATNLPPVITKGRKTANTIAHTPTKTVAKNTNKKQIFTAPAAPEMAPAKSIAPSTSPTKTNTVRSHNKAASTTPKERVPENVPPPPVQAAASGPVQEPSAPTASTTNHKQSQESSASSPQTLRKRMDHHSKQQVEHTRIANQKANVRSYIWTGVFLIIAGVALGLLFGKPAFLVSVVGIVFIVLGVMI